jgi:hypothetical protein
MTDDWKGEHLIRTVEPASHAGRNLKADQPVTGRTSRVRARRDEVRRLHGEMLTVLEITRQLGERDQTVRDDLAAMGLRPNRKGRAWG